MIEGKIYKVFPKNTEEETDFYVYKLVYYSKEPLLYFKIQGSLYSYIIDLKGDTLEKSFIKMIEGRPRSLEIYSTIEFIKNFEYTRMDFIRTLTFSFPIHLSQLYIVVCEGMGIDEVMGDFIKEIEYQEKNYSDFFKKMASYIIMHKIDAEST